MSVQWKGLRYICKHTNSGDSTKSYNSTHQQGLVSECAHQNIRLVYSLDDLTRHCTNSTLKYIYATNFGTEATTDGLGKLSFTTYDSKNPSTKHLDFKANKIIESNLMYENDTTLLSTC